MKKLLILFILSSFTLTVKAQNQPIDVIDKFFTLYESKGSDEALDYIFSTNKWMNNSQKSIDDIKYKLNGTIEQIGEYYGFYPIVTRTVKGHMELHTYIVKYNRQPLRFSFLLYKPNDTWRLQNFKYDDNLDAELEEASAVYRLDENIIDY
jgi:hypothetical protein